MPDACELCGGPVGGEADRITYYEFATNRERRLRFCEQCPDEMHRQNGGDADDE